MDIREYKEYAKKKYGEKSINESMLKHMDRVVGGRSVKVEDLNNINAELKIAQVIDSNK